MHALTNDQLMFGLKFRIKFDISSVFDALHVHMLILNDFGLHFVVASGISCCNLLHNRLGW